MTGGCPNFPNFPRIHLTDDDVLKMIHVQTDRSIPFLSESYNLCNFISEGHSPLGGPIANMILIITRPISFRCGSCIGMIEMDVKQCHYRTPFPKYKSNCQMTVGAFQGLSGEVRFECHLSYLLCINETATVYDYIHVSARKYLE